MAEKVYADTAKILSTYGDGFMLRTDSDGKIKDFKRSFVNPNNKWFKPIIAPNSSSIRCFHC